MLHVLVSSGGREYSTTHFPSTAKNFILSSRSGSTDFQYDAELRSSEGDALQTVMAALRCAYVFRCQLFHEAPEPADVVRWAPMFSHLLRQVTATCLFNLTHL
jgi:hypothetical protein